MYFRSARSHAVCDAGVSDELTHLHLQQCQYSLHHGHLHKGPPLGQWKGAHDCRQVKQCEGSVWFLMVRIHVSHCHCLYICVFAWVQSVYRGPDRCEHSMDPSGAVSPEWSALWLHPVHHQLPHATHCSGLHACHLLQTCQWVCEFPNQSLAYLLISILSAICFLFHTCKSKSRQPLCEVLLIWSKWQC